MYLDDYFSSTTGELQKQTMLDKIRSHQQSQQVVLGTKLRVLQGFVSQCHPVSSAEAEKPRSRAAQREPQPAARGEAAADAGGGKTTALAAAERNKRRAEGRGQRPCAPPAH